MAPPQTHARSSLAAPRALATVGSYLLQPVFIKWALHPEQCIDIYQRCLPECVYRLRMWNCTEHKAQFLVRAPGEEGMIKWAEHPELCLHAEFKGNAIGLVNCTSEEHHYKYKHFSLVESGSGFRIRSTDRHVGGEELCLNVPRPPSDNREGKFREYIQLWLCQDSSPSYLGADETFVSSDPFRLWATRTFRRMLQDPGLEHRSEIDHFETAHIIPKHEGGTIATPTFAKLVVPATIRRDVVIDVFVAKTSKELNLTGSVDSRTGALIGTGIFHMVFPSDAETDLMLSNTSTPFVITLNALNEVSARGRYEEQMQCAFLDAEMETYSTAGIQTQKTEPGKPVVCTTWNIGRSYGVERRLMTRGNITGGLQLVSVVAVKKFVPVTAAKDLALQLPRCELEASDTPVLTYEAFNLLLEAVAYQSLLEYTANTHLLLHILIAVALVLIAAGADLRFLPNLSAAAAVQALSRGREDQEQEKIVSLWNRRGIWSDKDWVTSDARLVQPTKREEGCIWASLESLGVCSGLPISSSSCRERAAGSVVNASLAAALHFVEADVVWLLRKARLKLPSGPAKGSQNSPRDLLLVGADAAGSFIKHQACTDRYPVIGDAVKCSSSGAAFDWERSKGKHQEWNLPEGGTAWVAAVDKEGDIRLSSADGSISGWTYRKFYQYADVKGDEGETFSLLPELILKELREDLHKEARPYEYLPEYVPVLRLLYFSPKVPSFMRAFFIIQEWLSQLALGVLLFRTRIMVDDPDCSQHWVYDLFDVGLHGRLLLSFFLSKLVGAIFNNLYQRDFTQSSSFLSARVFFILGFVWAIICCMFCETFIVVASEHDRAAWRWALDRSLLMQLFIPNPARLMLSGIFAMTYMCDSRRAVMEMSYINKMYGMFTSNSRVVNMAQSAGKTPGLARFNCLN